MRYNTLNETNLDLLAGVQKNQDEIERAQTKSQELVKENNDLILIYTSKLGLKQKQLDKMKKSTAYIEEGIQEKDTSGKERVLCF
jgi:hypothetical protein